MAGLGTSPPPGTVEGAQGAVLSRSQVRAPEIPGLSYLGDAASTESAYCELLGAANEEILVFNRPPYAWSLPELHPAILEMLGRGISTRVLYQRAELEGPGAATFRAETAAYIEAGVDVLGERTELWAVSGFLDAVYGIILGRLTSEGFEPVRSPTLTEPMTADEQVSVEALLAQALAAADDSDERWGPVRALHHRGDRPTFEAADALCRSSDPSMRSLGRDILAQLGLGEQPFLVERLTILKGLAGQEDDFDVLYFALCALGHLDDGRATEPLVRHRAHPDRDIRFAVAVALPGCLADDVTPSGVAALLDLMDDEDEEVRDWATFGLGSVLDVDGPEIGDALARRLSDRGADTSGEAMVGLARRRDPRCFEAIERALRAADVGNLVVEAAAELREPRLLPALEALDRAGWASGDPRGEWLARAIARRSGRKESQAAPEHLWTMTAATCFAAWPRWASSPCGSTAAATTRSPAFCSIHRPTSRTSPEPRPPSGRASRMRAPSEVEYQPGRLLSSRPRRVTAAQRPRRRG